MDLSFSQMMQMQEQLFEAHKEKWSPLEPEYGRDSILFMVEEIGEVIAILKKRGNRTVVENTNVREAFLEELADVMMYYNDVLLRYHVTPEEISGAYVQKFERNMRRDFAKEYKEKYNG